MPALARKKRPTRSVAAAVAALIVAAILQAWREPPSGRDSAARREAPGEARTNGRRALRYYTLALSLAPAFCERNAQRQQCARITADFNQRYPLTLHGLWEGPQGADSCMDRSPAPNPGELDARLRDWMPGMADGLHRHEWDKHGRRSCLGPQDYFRLAVDWSEQIAAALAPVLRAANGQRTTPRALRTAAEARAPGLGTALQFVCQQLPHRSAQARQRAYLVEVRACLGLAGPGQIAGWTDCRDVDQIDQGCPAEVWLDAPGDD